MKIKKVEISKKFQGIENLTIDLGDDPKKIIALVGPNGCGKSTIFNFFEDYQSTTYKDNINISDLLRAAFNRGQSKGQVVLLDGSFNKKSFYLRSPYRYTSELNITNIQNQESKEEDIDRPNSMFALDGRLQQNYLRIITPLLESLLNREKKTADDIVGEFIDNLNNSIAPILDIRLCSIGNPLKNRGQFYFKRHNDESEIDYNFLSAGEKEVFDIMLDLMLAKEHYTDTVFCIDEPELHINTSEQRKMLIEINKIIPDNCQLWIATHSIGFLRAMQEELKDNSQIINFSRFPVPGETLEPIQKTSKDWYNIFHTALDDIVSLITPEVIVYCEGSKGIPNATDATVYNTIFQEEYPNCIFVNAGGGSEMEKYIAAALDILENAFQGTKLITLRDKDEMSVEDAKAKNVGNTIDRFLLRKEIENYLFEWEIVKLAFPEARKGDWDTIFGSVDLVEGDLKSKEGALLEMVRGSDGHLSKERMKKMLAGKVKEKRNLFNELTSVIFGQEST